MKLFHKCCCGIDVHRSFLVANVRRYGIRGKKNLNEVRRFGTMTHDLLELGDWLKEAGCTHISIESTGVFWKPIFNVLGDEFEIILVNARGRRFGDRRNKSDEWLAARFLAASLLVYY